MSTSDDDPPRPDPALLGILALLAADRIDGANEPAVPTEVILERVGLPRPEIAKVVGKSPDAARKVIERASKPASTGKMSRRKPKGS